jgi:hypothetical protein
MPRDDIFVSSDASLDLSLGRFPENGCAQLGTMFDKAPADRLRAWIDARRPVRREIFYRSREEFEREGRWNRYAPGTKDHNLLLSPELDLAFIEGATAFKKTCSALCGADYKIMKKSIIRSTPRWAVPEWAQEFMADVGRPNLNPFVRDEYQDVQYFLTTDFHQDKTRPQSNFVTLYLYLDEVGLSYSALRILRTSHKLGVTVYPHSLRRSSADRRYWYYSDPDGNHLKCEDITVVGDAGSAFVFHCMTLHGTGYNDSKNPRVSLRYLIMKGPKSGDDTLLDRANMNVTGPRSVLHTRLDVGIEGAFLQTGSSLLSYD